ncbi:hypothetical protein M0805_008750 [Coniferiporia weirii]|nr:hypothetical protein M0805_008750 [Coniferiporia weirii]
MAPKVAIIIYTTHGHIAKMAEAVKSGVESAGGSTNIFQCVTSPETLDEDTLKKMHAPPKPGYPIFEPKELKNYDAFLFGIPTRYGNFPGQWKAFWDATGGLWEAGALWGKFACAFLTNLKEVHGGSPWGAGTLAGEGERWPSALELEIAQIQSKKFYETVARFGFGETVLGEGRAPIS